MQVSLCAQLAVKRERASTGVERRNRTVGKAKVARLFSHIYISEEARPWHHGKVPYSWLSSRRVRQGVEAKQSGTLCTYESGCQGPRLGTKPLFASRRYTKPGRGDRPAVSEFSAFHLTVRERLRRDYDVLLAAAAARSQSPVGRRYCVLRPRPRACRTLCLQLMAINGRSQGTLIILSGCKVRTMRRSSGYARMFATGKVAMGSMLYSCRRAVSNYAFQVVVAGIKGSNTGARWT